MFHSTLNKCRLLQCPFNKPQSSQNILVDFNIIATSPYLPTNAVFKIQNKYTLLNKSSLPLGQCSVVLQWQYPNKTWSTAWTVAPGPLKECSVHFQMCSPRFKGAMPPLEKPIFLHNMCSIIDKEHPFQKCNMFETVSTIEERSCASYHRATEGCPVWQKNILVKKQHSWKTGLVFDMFTLPPWSDQPSLHLDNSRLKKCFQYNRTIMYSFNRISLTYIKGMLHKDDHTLSKECYMHRICSTMHILQITIFFKRGNCPHHRELLPKYGSLSLEEYHILMHSEKICVIVKDIFYVLTYTMCFSF